jgi:hypothetical protein
MKVLESEIQRHLQEALASQTLDDVAVPFMPRGASVSSMLGQFRLKPMPAPFIPKAPNSVFQLSMML